MNRSLAAALVVVLALMVSLLGAGCGKSDGKWIVINREAGSGTRAVFEEKVMTWTDEAGATHREVFSLRSEQYMTNQQVLKAVAPIDNAIGYVSVGYLPYEGVRAITIDGIECTSATVFSGAYPISRSLSFTTKGEASEAGKAFLYWCQNDGQENTEPFLSMKEAMEQYGYALHGIAVSPKEGALPGHPTGGWCDGSLDLGGSTTILPLAEQWAARYKAAIGRDIRTMGVGSSSGARGCYEGSYDIGMLSRDLYKDEREAWGLVPYDIALDGVAIVVSSNVYEELGVTNLSMEQLRSIFSQGSGAAIPTSDGPSAAQASDVAAESGVSTRVAAHLISPRRREGKTR